MCAKLWTHIKHFTIIKSKLSTRQKPVLRLPLSKSMHIRAMLLEVVSGGICTTDTNTHTDDANLMRELLAIINSRVGQTQITELNVQNAGTVARFLCAYVSSLEGSSFIMTGAERMKDRPIKPLVDALLSIGADIRYIEKEGYFPLQIKGKSLRGGVVHVDAQLSSQYITALMLLAPLVSGGLRIEWGDRTTSFKYIDLSYNMLKASGADVNYIKEEGTQSILGVEVRSDTWEKQVIACESDWSAASFWYAAVALTKDLKIAMQGLREDSMQPDVAVKDIFSKLGVSTKWKSDNEVVIELKGCEEPSLELDLSDTPDIVPPLVVVCCLRGIEFEFSGINSLRVKESDRIEALMCELKKIGYVLSSAIENNTLIWTGKRTEPSSNKICTYGDHRIAMSMALAELIGHDIMIDDISVVSKSYPNFWEHFECIKHYYWKSNTVTK